MPVLSRGQLRRKLGQSYLQAATFGTTQIAVGAASTVCVMDPYRANPDYTNQNLYVRSHLRVASLDYRVGSYNTGSGAFVSAQLLQQAVASGADFEIYDRWTASELDRCIDQVIDEIRVNREVTFPGTYNANFYALAGVASPNTITDFNDVYYYMAADSTTNRQRGSFTNVNLMNTATGVEMRTERLLVGSAVIAIDAVLALSLGSADTATINVPDEAWILWGASARAWHLLAQRTPGQDDKYILERRAEAARAFSAKSAINQVYVSRRVSLQTPDDIRTSRYAGVGLNPFD